MLVTGFKLKARCDLKRLIILLILKKVKERKTPWDRDMAKQSGRWLRNTEKEIQTQKER